MLQTWLLSAVAGPLLSIGFAQGTAAQPLQSATVADSAFDTVVLVAPIDASGAYQGRGSGTIITPAGHILTNHHVVATGGQPVQRARIFVTTSATEAPRFAYVAEYVRGDARLDLAVLSIVEDANGRPIPTGRTFPHLAIVDHRGIRPNDSISIWGYPGLAGDSINSTRGTIGGFSGEDFRLAGDRWIRTDAQITPGNSGGAAITDAGHLVGVPTVVTRDPSSSGPFVFQQNWMRPAILVRELVPDLAGLRIVGLADGGACQANTAASLQQCVARGGTVRVAAGTYQIGGPLVVRTNVTLMGPGHETTRIVASARGVLEVDGGAVTISNVALAVQGTQPADVITVRAGSLTLRDALVSGGVASPSGDAARLGSGVRVTGTGNATIERSTVRSNGRHGIFTDTRGSVSIDTVHASQNGQAGIAVGGSSTPTITNSALTDNGNSGLFFAERAAGVARDNRSQGNHLDGIALGGHAAPRIEDNDILDNGRFGIYIDTHATPTIGANRIGAHPRGATNR